MNYLLHITKLLMAIFLIIILFFPIIIISILIKIESPGPLIHWSRRIGKNNKIFLMPKFRTMKIDVKDVATHLLDNPNKYITKVGKILRKSSLDEIPQLLSILKGEMNFVGPRPALFNQNDLIKLRTKKNIHTLKPGITGLAQIKGRDDLSIVEKIYFDEIYYKKNNFLLDIKIILLTFLLVFDFQNIKH